VALLAVPPVDGPDNLRLELRSGKAALETLQFAQSERKFPSETVALNTKNTELRSKPSAEKARETDALSKLLFTEGTKVYTTKAFSFPLKANTFRTSLYGDRRVYDYSDGTTATTVHAGIDFRAAKGTAVKAAARGRVAFAAFRQVTGNSVILEHMPGVYSIYYHLSKINVKVGEIVHAGQVIAHSGATGLATGPHLHFEIRIAGVAVDPDAMTKHSLLAAEYFR
jgi:murein DD-endopeptidase MepM/ murein hydrolase activator NlpD